MSCLLVEKGADGVARLTLNRPASGNALDLALATALMEAAIDCDEDPSVRAILLTGSGRLFCAGGDVSTFAKAGEHLPVLLKQITTYAHAAITRFARTEKPVITAVNGPVAGGGVGLAVVGDIVLMAPEAHFTLAYTALGLSPDCGASWLLPRLIGMRRAQEACLTNRRIGPEEAERIGLVTRLVETGTLAAEAEEVAQQLAKAATRGLGATKRLLVDSANQSLEAQLDAESRSIAALSRTPDGREGIAAHTARRAPQFTGEA